ncbi:MAG: hypothetical protein V4773_02795, partial [Verrucomicrobiota bacterium]
MLSVTIAAFVVFAPAASSAEQIEVPLSRVQGPNNAFLDPEYGVSLTYPEGWELNRGFRWGPNHEQTTFGIRRTRRPAIGTSLFYQKFSADSPRPSDIKAWFRDSFTKKEAAKKSEKKDYQNLPASLVFGTTSTGLPRFSYVAMFNEGSRTLVEYYVRIAGKESYVMFITQGTPEDLDAIRAEIDAMADTVRVP